MVGAILDAERALLVSDGLSRSDHVKLKDALQSEDPNESLHNLAQAGFTHAAELVNAEPGEMTKRAFARTFRPDLSIYTARQSIDAMVYTDGTGGGDAGGGIMKSAESVGANDTYIEALKNIEADKLKELIETLPERLQVILIYHYGLFGAPTLNLREIGDELGVTESRISQLHGKAKMRLAALWDEGASNDSSRLESFVTRRSSESDAKFLERMGTILEENKEKELSVDEVDSVLKHFPDWQRRRIKLGKIDYWLLQRTTPDLLANTIIEVAEPDSDRRKVGRKEDAIMILVQAIQGSDLQLALNIEKQLAQPMSAFAAQFSPRQLEVIADMYAPNGETALKLSIKPSTLRSHIHYAMKKLGINDDVKLALIMAREGLINLSKVPKGRTDSLSPRQRQILKDCHAMKYDEGTAELDISYSTYRTHWHDIYTELGASDRVQAVLMAVKDKLITL